VIGCFLMGLLVSGDGESIAVNLPMAAVPRRSFFQNWVVTHVGIRTGFCGALTTFASWNTQMVIMVCGGRGTQLGYSQWTSAIWGYVIGLYASLQSYQFGVAVAFCLSRWHHPELAKEADKIVDKQAIGVLINRDLPDFERRFLHSILIHEQNEGEEVRDDDHDVLIISTNGESQQQPKEKPKDNKRMKQYGEDNGYHSFYDDHIHHLEAWKVSTDNHRNGRGADDEDSYIQELHEIEKNLVVDKIEPRQELLDIARDAGWNIGALRNWTSELDREEAKRIVGYNDDDAPSDEGSDIQKEIEIVYFASSYSSLAEVVFNLGLFFITTALLIWSLVYFKKRRNSLLWRSNCLSALLAPFGTYSRWYLSRLNGSVQHPYLEWLPIGTFLANMIASVVSALMAAVLLDIDTDTNPMGATFAKAIQVGYAGSLSTVSTFATETTGLLRALPRAFWGYYYSFGSLICAFVLGFISYSWSVL
jgi:fluoride ion exporter CrcB/FEX